jgi:hypothetical protein
VYPFFFGKKRKLNLRWRRMFRLGATWLWIATLCSASLAAQTPDPTALQGTVADPSHAAVSAHITVTNETTGLTRAVDSDSAGRFTVGGLPVSGAYTVRITKQGFAAAQSSHVQLTPGSSAAVALTLKIAGETSIVTVEGAASGLRVDQPQLGISLHRHSQPGRLSHKHCRGSATAISRGGAVPVRSLYVRPGQSAYLNFLNHANFAGYSGTYGNAPTAGVGFGTPLAGITAQLPPVLSKSKLLAMRLWSASSHLYGYGLAVLSTKGQVFVRRDHISATIPFIRGAPRTLQKLTDF